MGRGSSKAGGGSGGGGMVADAIKGMTGYKIQTPSGDNMEMYFEKRNGDTYYTSEIGATPERTPNGMTEREMVSRIQDNGGVVEKYTKSELIEKEERRRKNRKESNKMLDQAYVNDKDMKQGSRSDRTGNRVRRRRQ